MGKKLFYGLIGGGLLWGSQVNSALQWLSFREVSKAISQLPGWQLTNGKLRKNYQFKDFVHAFSFMTRYNQVTIELVTYDVGGIRNLDIELAQKIDRLYE